MFNRVLQPIARRAAQCTRKYHGHSEIKPPSMDELPQPQGSWEEYNRKKRTSANIQLVAGIAVLAGTIAMAKVTGLVYLNWAPPTPKE